MYIINAIGFVSKLLSHFHFLFAHYIFNIVVYVIWFLYLRFSKSTSGLFLNHLYSVVIAVKISQSSYLNFHLS